MINDRSPLDLALRALRDVGVVRASVMVGPYARLWDVGLAERSQATAGKRDYRLSPAGVVLASNLKPWAETRKEPKG